MELTPDFSISINGRGIFPKNRVLSISVTDEAGFVSDSCEIELDDYDDALQLPMTEAKVEVAIGYKETGLTKMGVYFVKEVSIDGARQVIKISCNAAPQAMRSQKTKNNDKVLGEFVSESASEVDFSPAVDDEFGAIDLEDEAQIAESDMNYLTRLSQKIDALAKPINERLVVAKNGKGVSASGKTLSLKTINATDTPTFSCHFKEIQSSDGDDTGIVYANWYDKKTGNYHLEHTGTGKFKRELKEIFSSKEEAIAATRARVKRIQRTNRTFSFSIEGRPDLFAEAPIILRGFSKKIPKNWIIKRVEHSISSEGFTTSVECFENRGQ